MLSTKLHSVVFQPLVVGGYVASFFSLSGYNCARCVASLFLFFTSLRHDSDYSFLLRVIIFIPLFCTVLDMTGLLVSSLSAAQLRGIRKDTFADLMLTVKQFLEKYGVNDDKVFGFFSLSHCAAFL